MKRRKLKIVSKCDGYYTNTRLYNIKMKKNIIHLFVITVLAVSIASCGNDTPTPSKPKKVEPKKEVIVPVFNQDSAYRYVKEQVDFGPRVPNSKAHAECATYLVKKFESFGAQVIEQKFKSRSFDGKILSGVNIVASYNPDASKRVLLCSHWDSRPFADNDPDPKNHNTPIDGANDGASGVGILMEIARQIQSQPIDIGIDIVLFDLEDYGQPSESDLPQVQDSWALGAQYWSKTPHIPGYRARYGILLDMVGAKDILFTKEYFSMGYASGTVEKVWQHAAKLGYDAVFQNIEAGSVMDDHVYVNKFAQIPTIDIIHHDNTTESSFFPYWHTVKDNMDAIEPSSLNIVGRVLLDVIYHE